MVRYMPSGTCESRRYFLLDDGLGFSFHWTRLYANAPNMLIHYKNHLEAVLCVSGACEVEEVSAGQREGDGIVHRIEAETAYALSQHERHYLRNPYDEPCDLICAFNPPCAGPEEQSPEGVFPVIGADGVANYAGVTIEKYLGDGDANADDEVVNDLMRELSGIEDD